jgi:DUF4097 and DUF4098 domain-containing protein YvlB
MTRTDIMATSKHTTLVVAASLALAMPAAGQGGRPDSSSAHLRYAAYGQSRGVEQSERYSKTFRVGPTGTLDLSNISGDVTVTGGGGTEVVISAVKRARDRDPGRAKEQLGKVTIEANERGAGRIEVRTVYADIPGVFGGGDAPMPRHAEPPAPPGRGEPGIPPSPPRVMGHTNVDVDYTVTVPSGATVYLKSYAGNIKVTNVKGELRAETMSGDVQASETGRAVWLKTISGDVTVSATAPDGDVTVTSVNGEVTARGVRARGFEASVISGDIHLVDVACSHVRSLAGTVDFTGSLARNGRYEFRVHSGGIRLALTPTPGFELDAETLSGHIRSDLSITQRAGGDQERNAWMPERQTLRGTYGDSSAYLMVRSFSGDITIVKK